MGDILNKSLKEVREQVMQIYLGVNAFQSEETANTQTIRN